MNIGTGATATGQTKTIKIGTEALYGSAVSIKLGCGVGTSTVYVNGICIPKQAGTVLTLNCNLTVQTGNVTITGDASGTSVTLPSSLAISSLTSGHALFASASNTVSGESYLCPTRGGTGRGTLTSCYILYGCETNAVGLSNQFVFDHSNNRIGIGTCTPGHKLHLVGSSAVTCAYGFTDSATNTCLCARIEYNCSTCSIDFVIG